MWRFSAATVSLLLCAACAPAHEGYPLKLEAEFQKKGQFSFVFVEGHAHFPDGTLLRVGVRHTNQATYLQSMRVMVRGADFVAEFGPWNKNFPPGKYIAVVEFKMTDQTKEMEALIRETGDKCVKDDPEYLKEYEKLNPERARRIKEHLQKFGTCPSDDQAAGDEFFIGSQDQVDMARDEEDAFLRDTADHARELLVSLASLARHENPSEDADALARLESIPLDWIALETAARLRRTQAVFTERAAVYDRLSVAFLTMLHLHEAVADLATGKGAATLRELEALEAKAETATKDERRHRAALRERAATLRRTIESLETRAATSLAEALHGSDGLDPAGAKKSAWLRELKKETGIDLKD